MHMNPIHIAVTINANHFFKICEQETDQIRLQEIKLSCLVEISNGYSNKTWKQSKTKT